MILFSNSLLNERNNVPKITKSNETPRRFRTQEEKENRKQAAKDLYLDILAMELDDLESDFEY